MLLEVEILITLSVKTHLDVWRLIPIAPSQKTIQKYSRDFIWIGGNHQQRVQPTGIIISVKFTGG